MSTGDEDYNEPYFYINPWPYLDAHSLPVDIAPGHWHTKGYVGSVVTATDLLGARDVSAAVSLFVEQSFDFGKQALGVVAAQARIIGKTIGHTAMGF